MVLLDVSFYFSIESVAVYGNPPTPMGVGAEGDRTSIDEVRVWGNIIVSAESTRVVDKGFDVVFFLNRHVVSSSAHGVFERGINLEFV